MDKELLAQANAVRAHRKMARKKRYRRSRLDRLHAEILELDAAGYSLRDIAAWLRKYQRIRVAHTTVGRAINRWKAATTAPTD